MLMLPSILVQLPVDTFLAVMHTMTYGVSSCSDVICGMISVTACIAYIGKTKIRCSNEFFGNDPSNLYTKVVII
jgi:hypothetical protein